MFAVFFARYFALRYAERIQVGGGRSPFVNVHLVLSCRAKGSPAVVQGFYYLFNVCTLNVREDLLLQKSYE